MKECNAISLESTVDVHRVRELLGPDVVLTPLKPMSKIPDLSNWQKLTAAAMNNRVHLKRLSKAENIGVVLGAASGGLCTIDLDDDRDVEPFLVANPLLRSTTQTRRVRGCNLWVRVQGECPPTTKLTLNGRPFGEWRADGAQTVICGSAIDRKKGETQPTEYRLLNPVSPITLRFEDIHFHKNAFSSKHTPPSTHSSEYCISASLRPTSYVSTSLHNTATILEIIRGRAEAEKALAARHPALARMYAEFIEPRFVAIPSGRNDFILHAVPFLYRAVASRFVLELIAHFYDCNRSTFHDSREQHLREAQAMLTGVSKTYADKLSADERKIYAALSEPEQDSFRICRDLALLQEPEREPFTFFLAFNHLGDRLGIFPMQAQRIMRRFVNYGLLKLLKPGTRRKAGVRGEAGIYIWLLESNEPKAKLL